jgi:predicted RNase H-like HicB family nuclease
MLRSFTMKTKAAVFAVFALSLAGAALADNGTYPESELYKSEGPGKSRAEVVAEVLQAQRDGTLGYAENEFPSSVHSGPGKSRAEVIAEMEEAQKLGLLMTGESGNTIATVEQNEQIADAGRRAASIQLAGK